VVSHAMMQGTVKWTI